MLAQLFRLINWLILSANSLFLFLLLAISPKLENSLSIRALVAILGRKSLAKKANIGYSARFSFQ